MSYQIYDSEPPRDSDLWTSGRLIEEVFLDLAKNKEIIHVEDGKKITIHKYYHQAREKIHRIPLHGNLIPFVIHLSDLSEKVRKELDIYYKETGEKELALVLKMAVMKIFENLGVGYTHMSVMKNLTLRLIN
mgnify:CR=1 FL=1